MSSILHNCRTAIAIALAVLAASCSSNSSSSSTTAPSSPSTTTDTFTGTVAPQGTTGVPFVVANTGTITIGLTAVSPLSTMALGVGLATWDGTACGTTPVSKNDNARSGATALTGTATAGNYCVTVYDSGNIPDGWSVSYTVQVAHP